MEVARYNLTKIVKIVYSYREWMKFLCFICPSWQMFGRRKRYRIILKEI